MDRNKDLSVVFLSDPCEERSVQVQTVIGRVDVHSVMEEVNRSKERGTYTKWKEEDRFEIGDYVLVNGHSAALRKYKLVFWVKREYHSLIQNRNNKGDKRCFKRATLGYTITEKVLESPLLLGKLDAKVQLYIKAVSSRGAIVNSSLAIAAGKALIQKYPNAVGNIDIDSSTALRCESFSEKNIEQKHLCRHEKNYCYFCKLNIPVTNLIVGSRNLIKLSKNMSL